MFTGSILLIVAIVYIVLKILNTRAEFARRDAERIRREQEAEAAMDEAAEEEEIRETAVDVEAETISNDDIDAEEFIVESVEVPEVETV
jgi:hypothetical protein